MAANRKWKYLQYVATVCCICASQTLCQAQRAPFWRELVEPNYAMAYRLLAQGRVWRQTAEHRNGATKNAALDNALSRFVLANRLLKSDAVLKYAYAEALSARYLYGLDPKRNQSLKLAVRLFETVRQLDRTYKPANIAIELATLWTKLEYLDAAIEEYENALALYLEPVEVVPQQCMICIARANYAEVLMLNHRVEDAIDNYTFALREALVRQMRPRQVSGIQMGLAVARDRLGHVVAIDDAQSAMETSKYYFDFLSGEDLFFQPASEVFYFIALGHEGVLKSLTQRESEEGGPVPSFWLSQQPTLQAAEAEAVLQRYRLDRSDRLTVEQRSLLHRHLAVHAWRQFVADEQSDPKWVARATWHLQALGR